MNLDALIALQSELGLGDVHLVHLHEEGEHGGFHLAHTDSERQSGTNTEACPLHAWLVGFGSVESACEVLEVNPGTYILYAHEPDAVSESYRSEPWELHQLPDDSSFLSRVVPDPDDWEEE